MVLCRYWFLKECPFKKRCLDARKKPKLWGWTLEEAQNNLRLHLCNSSKHYFSGAEATQIIDAAEWQEDEQEFEEAQAKPEDAEEGGEVFETETVTVDPGTIPAHRAQKKQRVVGGSTGSGTSDSTVSLIARVVGETLKGMQSAQVQQPFAPPSTMPSLTGAFPGGSDDTISFRRSQLQAIVDCCSRASHAAKQAEMLSQSAARAFASEAASLDRCKEFLQRELQQ